MTLARMREQTSMAATAKHRPGRRASSLIRLIAEVEPTNTVYRWPPSCLWSRARRPADGEGLHVEDPPAGSEAEATSDPPLLGPSDAGRSHPAVVLSRAVGPGGISAAPLACGLEGRCPLQDDDPAGEARRCAPLLHLCRTVPSLQFVSQVVGRKKTRGKKQKNREIIYPSPSRTIAKDESWWWKNEKRQ